ncbi:hypothetical protein JYU34_015806 [Plutella xylostella]|uniref:Uncharacterized protein n=1 Tax=Plutella xylostella TaxID=51655 RepID=A0ABQ7Q4X8_PLUXY|nr:hypothetical protein JYU34_015806 [Plutella xylostella]
MSEDFRTEMQLHFPEPLTLSTSLSHAFSSSVPAALPTVTLVGRCLCVVICLLLSRERVETSRPYPPCPYVSMSDEVNNRCAAHAKIACALFKLVGHCETAALRCASGALAASSVLGLTSGGHVAVCAASLWGGITTEL